MRKILGRYFVLIIFLCVGVSNLDAKCESKHQKHRDAIKGKCHFLKHRENRTALDENQKGDCFVPCVDVSGPLHVEHTEFGQPIVVGTPTCGPKHGVGSYWYQVGYLFAQDDAKSNFAPVVVTYLQSAGRQAEFIVDETGDLEASDIHTRRVTYTTAQIENQVETQLCVDYPADILDFLNGAHQAYIDHILKIQNGLEVLPADFVTGVGILNWFWEDVVADINVARSLFTVANFVRQAQLENDSDGATNTAFLQLFDTFDQIDVTSVAPTSQDAINILNDIYGLPQFTPRFTVKQGDLAGIFCATCKKTSSQKFGGKQFNLSSAHSSCVEQSKMRKEKLAKKMSQLQARHERPHHSDFLVVGSELTENRSVMMFGNPQANVGFDSGAGLSRAAFRTPRGSVDVARGTPNYIATDTGYSVICSEVDTPTATRDGVFEDSKNLVLIYNPVTQVENVPGGKAHSRILLRQNDGSVVETFTTVYQGNAQRPGLEFDFREEDPNDPANEFVYITRQPCDWLIDVGGFLKGQAVNYGMLRFRNLQELAELYDTFSVVKYIGGFDNEGNIFSIDYGLHPTLKIPNFNRFFPGDATSSQFYANLSGRPLPVPADSDYICLGSTLVKNPSCGFLTGWNGFWSTESQTWYTGDFEYDRVGALYYHLDVKVKEKGKLNFEDIQSLWTSAILERQGASVTSSSQFFQTNPFPVFRDDFIEALKAKGAFVGLTQEEINRTLSLLGPSYDGRSIPFNDQTSLVEGRDYDGRWVLSSLWLALLQKNFWEQGVVGADLIDVTSSVAGMRLDITAPNGDDTTWSKEHPGQSRVLPVKIAGINDFIAIMLRVLKMGPDLGNPVFYPWAANIKASTGLDMNILGDRQQFIAQALKEALEIEVTGSNAGTGLKDSNTGRANLNLIQDNGIPLHPGWGKHQRTLTFGDRPPYVTQFLIDNFTVRDNIPTAFRLGSRIYAERDRHGRLKHYQHAQQLGYSSLLTVNKIKQSNVVTVQPHATDQAPFFEGNYETEEIPLDSCKTNCKKGRCTHH